MATIKDYLRWRGDLSFGVAPFNIVDNLVLATLAYVDLTDTGANTEAGVTVAHAVGTILDAGDLAGRIRSVATIDAETLRLLAGSTRFGAATIHHYRDETDAARTLQFAAFTCDLAADLTAVAFRGTDHSLAGWHEDFLLGCKVTAAQQRAAAYLERMAWRAAREGRRVQVCGHSKGGNLAAYAACELHDSLMATIAHVWSNDGPGMAAEVAPANVVSTLGASYTHVVPAYSIVGMLFVPADDPAVVVRSSASGFLQHDLTTWEVGAVDVVHAGGLSPESVMVAETFAAWLEGIDLVARERFVNEVFAALSAGDPNRIDAVLASPAAVSRVLAATSGMSPASKDVARKLFDVTVASVAGAAASAAGRAADDVTGSVRTLATDVRGSMRTRS